MWVLEPQALPGGFLFHHVRNVLDVAVPVGGKHSYSGHVDG